MMNDGGPKNCTVRALSTVTGLSIFEAAEMARKAGRKDGRAMQSPVLIAAAMAAGSQLTGSRSYSLVANTTSARMDTRWRSSMAKSPTTLPRAV